MIEFLIDVSALDKDNNTAGQAHENENENEIKHIYDQISTAVTMICCYSAPDMFKFTLFSAWKHKVLGSSTTSLKICAQSIDIFNSALLDTLSKMKDIRDDASSSSPKKTAKGRINAILKHLTLIVGRVGVEGGSDREHLHAISHFQDSSYHTKSQIQGRNASWNPVILITDLPSRFVERSVYATVLDQSNISRNFVNNKLQLVVIDCSSVFASVSRAVNVNVNTDNDKDKEGMVMVDAVDLEKEKDIVKVKGRSDRKVLVQDEKRRRWKKKKSVVEEEEEEASCSSPLDHLDHSSGGGSDVSIESRIDSDDHLFESVSKYCNGTVIPIQLITVTSHGIPMMNILTCIKNAYVSSSGGDHYFQGRHLKRSLCSVESTVSLSPTPSSLVDLSSVRIGYLNIYSHTEGEGDGEGEGKAIERLMIKRLLPIESLNGVLFKQYWLCSYATHHWNAAAEEKNMCGIVGLLSFLQRHGLCCVVEIEYPGRGGGEGGGEGEGERGGGDIGILVPLSTATGVIRLIDCFDLDSIFQKEEKKGEEGEKEEYSYSYWMVDTAQHSTLRNIMSSNVLDLAIAIDIDHLSEKEEKKKEKEAKGSEWNYSLLLESYRNLIYRNHIEAKREGEGESRKRRRMNEGEGGEGEGEDEGEVLSSSIAVDKARIILLEQYRKCIESVESVKEKEKGTEKEKIGRLAIDFIRKVYEPLPLLLTFEPQKNLVGEVYSFKINWDS